MTALVRPGAEFLFYQTQDGLTLVAARRVTS